MMGTAVAAGLSHTAGTTGWHGLAVAGQKFLCTGFNSSLDNCRHGKMLLHSAAREPKYKGESFQSGR
jgi:hypothetical protein